MKWDIPLVGKQKRVQFVSKLWTEPHDPKHVKESTEIVSKFVGFCEGGNISREMFDLNFVLPFNKRPWLMDWTIGLTSMFNNVGTIKELEYVQNGAKINVKRGGNFLAYSNESPKKFELNGVDVPFEWLPNGKLTINIPWIEEDGGVSDLAILF
ncbi:hypothetical protein PIB30_083600 [Stylosanthes scabra]|uniref:NPK1-activating kinesin-like protein C-terminal domain-containing protein n=1 Tax=Stylosanthes scabra TaxID=79078 RepID=A0ABU6UU32_9FABA|nr:hypothetical protein [Stylosanthes scabra]